MLLPLLSGALLYLAMPPASLWWLSFVALVPLFLFLVHERRLYRIVLGAFFFRLTLAFLFLLFVPDPFLVFSVAAFWFGFGVCAWVGRRFIVHTPTLLLFLCADYTLWEYLTSLYGLLPASEASLATTLGSSPFLLLARPLGLFGLCLFILVINAVLTFFYLEAFKEAGRHRLRMVLRGVFATALFLGSAYAYVVFPQHAFATQPLIGTKILSISVANTFDRNIVAAQRQVQGNARSLQAMALIGEQLAEFKIKIEQEKPNLVVLPEYMIDLELPNDRSEAAYQALGIENAGMLLDAYAALAREERVSVLAPLTTIETDGHKYISAILIDSKGAFVGKYHKSRLVITGEYWPFGSWKPFYWDWALSFLPPETKGEAFIGLNPTGPYTRAASPYQTLILPETNHPFGVLLCSEGQYFDAYAALAAKHLPFIIHISDNSWIKKWSSSYTQSVLNLRRIEAVHHGIPIVVSGKGEASYLALPDGSLRSEPLNTVEWVALSIVL